MSPRKSGQAIILVKQPLIRDGPMAAVVLEAMVLGADDPPPQGGPGISASLSPETARGVGGKNHLSAPGTLGWWVRFPQGFPLAASSQRVH